MQTPDIDLGERGYKPEHIKVVLSGIAMHFPDYFRSFCPSVKGAKQAFDAAIGNWERDNPAYDNLFDLETLEEYEDDPNAFKSDLRTKCPIIRRCLNSPAREMKKYKISFNSSTGRKLLDKSKRFVGITERVRVALWRAKPTRTRAWVFPSARAESGHSETVQKQFERAKQMAGLPESVVLYCARHRFSTDAMEGTGNLMAVMDVMGHEKFDTTRLYNHPGTKQIRDAIERRNQLVQ